MVEVSSLAIDQSTRVIYQSCKDCAAAIRAGIGDDRHIEANVLFRRAELPRDASTTQVDSVA
jgi:hypothetical protein